MVDISEGNGGGRPGNLRGLTRDGSTAAGMIVGESEEEVYKGEQRRWWSGVSNALDWRVRVRARARQPEKAVDVIIVHLNPVGMILMPCARPKDSRARVTFCATFA